jgi:hypothetical protein
MFPENQRKRRRKHFAADTHLTGAETSIFAHHAYISLEIIETKS